MNRIVRITVYAVLVTAIGSPWARAQGPGPGPGPEARECSVPTLVWELPLERVRPREARDLRYLREEEKLARDVYLSLYERWGTRLFKKIARQEKNHMSWALVLLDKYELSDPAEGNGIGVFTNDGLQELYNDLVRIGGESIVDALTVGAALEELNIYDLLTRALARADNEDLRALYQNLTKGSRNHLRRFVTRLENHDVSYESTHLSPETYSGIVDTPLEKGLLDSDGEWICGGWK